MRVKSSIINIIAGLGNQIIITLLSFISRTLFIRYLGIEYLGVNGLFTNILSMLTLAEAGIGTSIIYSLYKPVAENDYDKINKLMRLYKQAYLAIALIVSVLGLSVLPFLDSIVTNADINHLYLIYLIFLANTVIPYLFSYNNSFLGVAQKNYIVTIAFSLSSIISTCIKIAILYFTGDYILFLLTDVFFTIITASILTWIVYKKYPYLKKRRNSGKLDKETKAGIIKNIKAVILQNIGSYLVLGTENILISTFVSIAAVGLYSNYKMLIDIARTFINQIFQNLYHSVGNLVSVESDQKIYSVYKVMMLLSFWLYSMLAIVLYFVINPFILLWIGSRYVMSSSILLLLLLLFMERGMRNPISMVKTTAGIFHEDRYVPLVQAVVSLGLSILLVHRLGISGVFIGSLAGVLFLPFWTTPYLTYKKVFHQSVTDYYRSYFKYMIIAACGWLASYYAEKTLEASNMLGLIGKGTIILLVVNLLYIAVFHRTEEFMYLFRIVKGIVRKAGVKSGVQAKNGG